MKAFLKTSYLSDILEYSKKSKVVIFKFSKNCGSSHRLVEKIKKIRKKENLLPIFLVTLQEQKSLSQNISEYFNIKHESPQIIIIKDGEVVNNANHDKIDLLFLKIIS
jgi:bacillithiol system protein YtxJ